MKIIPQNDFLKRLSVVSQIIIKPNTQASLILLFLWGCQAQLESVWGTRTQIWERLRLKGKNFIVYPQFLQTTIDGEFGFGLQTKVLADGSAETVVHIPNPETFDLVSEHLVILATPFGISFKGC
ncbi:MAG: hypothetical protein ACO1RX_04745 [Candidatus Sericytochromatia bacterium]